MNLPEADQELEALLAYLKQERSCDLTSYQRSTLIRQFDLRMQRLNINSYLAYLDYLQCHDEEWTALLDNALISFTGFFYDRPAWECIANDILPRILASKQPNEHIRVWSAGCASGQEVYSLVMLFAEALGIESCLKRVQFYATDIDVAVLQQARKAIYSRSEVGEIPTALLNKYFKQTSQGYVFHRKLRATVIFGQHNLAIDAPVSRIDLLVCRNALIYWGMKTQVSVLIRFHFALQTNGFLLLGKAETLTNRHQIFKPFNVKQRIYTKEIDLKLDDQPVTEPPLPVLDRAPPRAFRFSNLLA